MNFQADDDVVGMIHEARSSSSSVEQDLQFRIFLVSGPYRVEPSFVDLFLAPNYQAKRSLRTSGSSPQGSSPGTPRPSLWLRRSPDR